MKDNSKYNTLVKTNFNEDEVSIYLEFGVDDINKLLNKYLGNNISVEISPVLINKIINKFEDRGISIKMYQKNFEIKLSPSEIVEFIVQYLEKKSDEFAESVSQKTLKYLDEYIKRDILEIFSTISSNQ
jgi:predicted component of type VI protein secretion system